MEKWLPIPNREEYEISSLGRVRKADRILTGYVRSDGHLVVSLGDRKTGKTYYIRRLVCLAFIGTCPKGQIAININGNNSDVRLENLRYAPAGVRLGGRAPKVTTEDIARGCLPPPAPGLEWREIPGHMGRYWISSKGDVWTRRDSQGVARFLRTFPGKKGYRTLGLRNPEVGKTTYMVHALVALAFFGPRPPGMMVCHGDGDPNNNSADNLRYGTAADNSLDRIKHERSMRGELCPVSKLTEKEVLSIRSTYIKRHPEFGSRALAEKFSVNPNTILDILKRRTWGHLP